MTELTSPKVFERRLLCASCAKPVQMGDEPKPEECTCEVLGDVDFEDCRYLLPGAEQRPNIVLRREPGVGPLVSLHQRWVVHSPSGFEWGFGGSGPSDLALNILGEFLPPPEAWRLHQRFKWDRIAPLPQAGEHVITAPEVIGWIRSQWEAGR